VLQRIAARLVTGPFAFLVGGVIDISVFAAAALRARLRRSDQRLTYRQAP